MPVTTVTIGGLAANSANNIVTSITPTSGTTLTLNGALVTSGVAIMDKPRRVLLTFGNEGSNRTMVITGTNSDGNPIQETLAVASGASGTVSTVQDFSTVISALPLGGGWTAAITLGTSTVGGSQWVFANHLFGPMDYSWGCTTTGTVTYQIDISYGPINSNINTLGSQPLGNYPAPPTFFPHATLNAKTSSADGSMTTPFIAWRVTITSGTGTVSVTGIQAGIFNG